ncbi:SCO family protein [Telluria aromaticivorans]|uniref:SCO family protein n=1 Tax=Telluria aromaticivorans TaxID=2725995 RepID=A0A7Y2NZ49_9BURK|nr:SCO family protein [Telluria aromaticivorans]NNG21449.1 SCO family protein [Telluria aromaticivorans]
MTSLLSRRTFLRASAALGLLGLAGCTKDGMVRFHGTNVTGATYGRDFRLTDPDGRKRTLAAFKGQAILLFFGYTQCPDVCPTALARAVDIKRLLGEDGGQLQVLFVTVDPERDTPEVLKAYTAAFDPSFLALYSDLAGLAQMAQEFNLIYKKVPTGASYSMDHTSVSYVYDPRGKLRLKFLHSQSADACAADLRNILRSA